MTSALFLLVFIFLPGSGSTAQPVSWSAIYVIHGDSDYLFHNEKGQAVHADERVLKQAQRIGKNASAGEVFIFHQKPERKWLGLFPVAANRMLHYRNGELVTEETYRSRPGSGIFEEEAERYRQHHSVMESMPRLFLYFGHEIPVRKGKGYYRSDPAVEMNTTTFIRGVKEMAGRGGLFDLIVLSTCNNGTPQMIRQLSPVARWILASPQNLHLSHIDTGALLHLDEREGDKSSEVGESAARLAEETFSRMSRSLKTAVTLSLYETEKIQVPEPAGFLGGVKNHPGSVAENMDCADLSPEWKSREEGVRIWYNPAAFGRYAGKKTHSGWGCRK